MQGRLDELSEFLLQLYREARGLEPDAFQRRVLERLQALVPFDFVAWGCGEAEERQVNEVLVRHQDPRVLTDWPEVGPWDRFCDLTLERINRTWQFDDVPDYRRSLAYNEHWRRFDVSHQMATIMREPMDGYVSFLNLFHEDMARPFTEEERDLVQILMPHLAEALRVNRQWTVTTALEEAEATALVDRAGRILVSQGPFAALFKEEWGSPPGLTVPEALLQACGDGTTWRGRRIQVRFRRFGQNFLLRIHPVSPASTLPPRAREVAELFGAGFSHKEVARRLEISPETVRKHLAYIYDQLGIQSKASLARLIHSESPPRHPGGA